MPFRNPPWHKKLPKSLFQGMKHPQTLLLWKASVTRPGAPDIQQPPCTHQEPTEVGGGKFETLRTDTFFPALPLNYSATYSRYWCYI